jgi:predicted Zn-ribbon and HTH transcriptional regulator
LGMDYKYRCPACKSRAVYQLISIVAKQCLNGEGKIYDIDKGWIDNYFSGTAYCKKCGWEGTQEEATYSASPGQ